MNPRLSFEGLSFFIYIYFILLYVFLIILVDNFLVFFCVLQCLGEMYYIQIFSTIYCNLFVFFLVISYTFCNVSLAD